MPGTPWCCAGGTGRKRRRTGHALRRLDRPLGKELPGEGSPGGYHRESPLHLRPAGPGSQSDGPFPRFPSGNEKGGSGGGSLLQPGGIPHPLLRRQPARGHPGPSEHPPGPRGVHLLPGGFHPQGHFLRRGASAHRREAQDQSQSGALRLFRFPGRVGLPLPTSGKNCPQTRSRKCPSRPPILS